MELGNVDVEWVEDCLGHGHGESRCHMEYVSNVNVLVMVTAWADGCGEGGAVIMTACCTYPKELLPE